MSLCSKVNKKMKLIESFFCLDTYEREKLCGLFSIQKDGKISILDIINIIENELIILLYDKSCHSVTMKDDNSALQLFQLFKEIKNGRREFLEIQNSNKNNEVLIVTNIVTNSLK